MKYDDASWHYDGDFPEELPNEKGATHIGMFFAWCLLNGLGSECHLEEFEDEFNELKNEKIIPGQYFINTCDEKLTDEDLSEEGNQFALYYYDSEDSEFNSDYLTSMDPEDELETVYHVEDSWENYRTLAAVISEKFKIWKKEKC